MRLATLALTGTLASTALVAAPTDAHAGPPWVSIELPANPLNAHTREAYLLVRTYHHERTISMALSGRAEGIVNGQRRSIPLTCRQVGDGALFALDRSWPTEGTWLLVITGGEVNGKGGATALVGIDAKGEVTSVRVPSRKDGQWVIPTTPSASEIEASLQTLAGLDSQDDGRVHLGFLPMLLIPAGVGATLVMRKR